jgi:hypothetical protein
MPLIRRQGRIAAHNSMKGMAMANNGQAALGEHAIPWRAIGWGFAVLLLIIPFVAMQFTREVNWTASDFAFAGLVIGGTGLLLELVVRRSARIAYRLGGAVALLATFLLVWINAAVGIIGSEDNSANLMFLGVILVAFAGAALARLRPAGMARAMAAAAAAELAVGIVVLTLGLGANEQPGELGLQALNGFFVALWALSAWLFRRAAT